LIRKGRVKKFEIATPQVKKDRRSKMSEVEQAGFLDKKFRHRKDSSS
jgi:hypothetical protein